MSTLPLFDGPGDRRARGDGNGRRVLRVAAVNRMVRASLEDRFPSLWVEGELSDVTRAATGHVYFTLNDEREVAQLRGVMFRSDARRAKARLANGERVQLRGTLSLYEPRGSFQLIARVALPQGQGDLHAQFEATRKKLEAEGLLDPERKRALPRVPRVVGVVTSESGAAIHDIVRVAHGRSPVRLVLAPCLVQGSDAPAAIVRALGAIQRLPQVEVVIVGRGGGSAEDLVAFNDVRVARAIAACRVPVVSAVGHEVDVSIADLVADVRAATPSNAAELVVPERAALVGELEAHRRALERAMELRVGRARLRLDRLARRVPDRRAAVMGLRARLLELRARLDDAVQGRTALSRTALSRLSSRLSRVDPRLSLSRDRARLSRLSGRLDVLSRGLTGARRAALSARAAQLSALSPLAILGRGYAIALSQRTGRALLRAADARVGDAVTLRLHEGSLETRVEKAGDDE